MEFKSRRRVVAHPVSQGDGTEAQWLKLLSDYVPQRYRVTKAFVLDCDGNLSDQIDVVIYDRQYCPFLFKERGTKYVPAESVYAVFEVRPRLNPGNIAYAAQKAASVRRLRRTTTRIPHAGGVYRPKRPPYILAGLLSVETGWKWQLHQHLREKLGEIEPEGRLDLICALNHAGVDAKYRKGKVDVEVSTRETALIFFFMKLLHRLQLSGTVAALDIEEYGRAL